MQDHKLLQNRIFVYLISLYLIGLLFGVFMIKSQSINLENQNKNFYLILFSNYWYIFLIWIFGFSILGFITTTIIVFTRALIFGIMIRGLIIISFKSFLILLILEIIFIFPIIIIISYYSLKMSIENLKLTVTGYSSNNYLNKYLNLMLIATVIMIIYSLIVYIN